MAGTVVALTLLMWLFPAGNIAVLAGSCLGGGTTINWSASFALPAAVRDMWVGLGHTRYGPGQEYEQALRHVSGLNSVNTWYQCRYSYR